MQKLGTFFKKAKDTITEKLTQAIDLLETQIEQLEVGEEKEPVETSLVKNQIETQQQPLSKNNILQNEKVLEIDVVESNVIKTQEEIKAEEDHPQQTQRTLINQNQVSQHQEPANISRLQRIEQEKKSILEQLKKLDEEIADIKGENVEDGALKRRQKQEQKQEAINHAKDLVKQLKMQKRQMEERKRKETEKTLLLLKQQDEERKAKKAEQLERAKQQRRKKIQARMEEERRKKQERRQIELQSNKLIKQIKKEQSILKQKQELPHDTIEVEQKKKIVEKRQEINFRQIEEHERRYIQYKEQERSIKKQRSDSVNHHVQHYKKNMWLEQIEEQEQKRKQQEKNKEDYRRGQLEKRKKYGQLVKNIFIPKQIKKGNSQQPKERQNLTTPDTVVLPKIPQSQKRITDSKQMKKFIHQNRPFATAHNPKPPRPQKIQVQKKQEDLEAEKERKAKEAEIRRQTKERLKKMENKSLDKLIPQKSKPKYENYLGRMKHRPQEPSAGWKKVIDNDNLSKQDKYKEMLRRAAAMQNKAKVKQQIMKDGDQQAVNLYIGSIQAKLAILEKF